MSYSHPLIRDLLSHVELSPDAKNASCAPLEIDRLATLLRTDYKKDIAVFVELAAVWSAFATKNVEPIASQVLGLLEIVKEQDARPLPAPIAQARPMVGPRVAMGSINLRMKRGVH